MSIRVVIAEDDPQIAEIQQRFLHRIEGFELVGIAHGIVETKDLVEVLQPDLLLLDVHFPDGTGLDLLRDLRTQRNTPDVILITASKDVATLREAMHGGAFYFLIKPLTFERLQEALLGYQKHLNKLTQMGQLAQTDVDKLFNTAADGPSKIEARLPKGVDGITLDKARKSLTQNPNKHFSAEDMGEIIGASRTTARRYLEYLTSTSEANAEVSYGSVGRPERRYKKC